MVWMWPVSHPLMANEWMSDPVPDPLQRSRRRLLHRPGQRGQEYTRELTKGNRPQPSASGISNRSVKTFFSCPATWTWAPRP